MKVSGPFANPKVNETSDYLLNNCMEKVLLNADTPAVRERMNHVAKHLKETALPTE